MSIKEKISDFIQQATSLEATQEGSQFAEYALSTNIFLFSNCSTDNTRFS